MKSLSKRWYWAPRILGICFALFLVIFSFDVFGQGQTFGQTVGAFLLHNLPSMILGLILWVAWKKEIVGAIAFSLIGTLYVAQMIYNAITRGFEFYMVSNSAILAGPLFIIGALFWFNWKHRNR